MLNNPATLDNLHDGQPRAELAFRSLLRGCGLIRRVMEPLFQEHGISGAQWGVLRVLYEAERGGVPRIRLGDLGERLLIRPPSVTSVVDRLERDGLIIRVPSDRDQRSKDVELTAKGRGLVGNVAVSHAGRVDAIMSGIDAEGQIKLQDILDRLSDHLEGMIRQVEAQHEPLARNRT